MNPKIFFKKIIFYFRELSLHLPLYKYLFKLNCLQKYFYGKFHLMCIKGLVERDSKKFFMVYFINKSSVTHTLLRAPLTKDL